MRRSMVVAVAACVATTAFGAKLDLDFQAISDNRDAKVFEGRNLLNATNFPIRLVNKPGDKPRREVGWRVALPHDRGGDFVFAVAYRMNHDRPFLGGGVAEVRDARNRNLIHETRLVESAWRDPFIARAITVMGGCNEVEVRFVLNGTGSLEVSRARFDMLPEPEDVPVEMHCMPAHWLDGKVFISSGQAGVVAFNWQTHNFRGKPFRRFPQKDISFELTIPRGFSLSEAAFGDMAQAKCVRRPDGGEKWTFPAEREGFDVPNYRPPFFDLRYRSIVHSLLIRSTGEAGVEGDLSLTMLFEGERISNTETVRLVTGPHVQAMKPKRWQSGLFIGPKEANFRTDQGLADYVRFACDCGSDLLIHGLGYWHRGAQKKFEPRFLNAWRAGGIRTVLASCDWLADGHLIGLWEGRPESDRYVCAKSFGIERWYYPDELLAKGVCPAAVYEERPFFVTNTLPWLAEITKGEDGVWSNWEPWAFKDVGCFCTGCLNKFAAYMGKTPDEVAADWPKCAMEGGKWRKEAIAFRVAEHAKLVRTIDKHVTKFTGGEKSYGLVLGVSFPEMTYTAREIDVVLPEYSPLGYAADMKWINAWGPYPHYRIFDSYVYYKRDVLRTWFTAKDIREQTDKDYPAGHRPKLMAMPQGEQGCWIPKPGWFEMSIDAFFFNGWHALAPFQYPQVLDARWWQAFADATTRAAKYEDFVYDGHRVDGRVALESVPEYAHQNVGCVPRLPKYVDEPMLHEVAYDYDGVRIVAVFNFWDWGEAFFKLKTTDLADGDWTVVDEDGTRYQPSATRTAWTVDEMAKGILLAVPKTTTRVFELRPSSRPGKVKTCVTAADIAGQYELRRTELKKLADADAEYERVNAPKSKASVKPTEAKEAAL